MSDQLGELSVGVDNGSPRPSPTSTPSKAESGGDHRRSLTFWKLCALTFASVAGGPYGFEEAVGAGGPYLTLTGLLLVPFVWSVPNALMTAELACMMPENGGHILWVNRAFGTFWSFQNSYSTLFSTIFEGGLYPVMFMDYMGELLGMELKTEFRLGIGLVVIAAVTYMNIKGTDVVGNASMGFTVASLGPFILIILLGLPHLDLVNVVQAIPEKTNWTSFITILLWSTSGFDLVGACAGEVKNPAETFPSALSFAMALTLIIDLLSMAVGMSVVTTYSTWTDGTFIEVARVLGGQWLSTVFLCGAAVSVVSDSFFLSVCRILSYTIFWHELKFSHLSKEFAYILVNPRRFLWKLQS